MRGSYGPAIDMALRDHHAAVSCGPASPSLSKEGSLAYRALREERGQEAQGRERALERPLHLKTTLV